MSAERVAAFVIGAVVAFSAIAEAIRRMRKAARPEPPQWTDEQIDRLAETLRKEGDEL